MVEARPCELRTAIEGAQGTFSHNQEEQIGCPRATGGSRGGGRLGGGGRHGGGSLGGGDRCGGGRGATRQWEGGAVVARTGGGAVAVGGGAVVVGRGRRDGRREGWLRTDADFRVEIVLETKIIARAKYIEL